MKLNTWPMRLVRFLLAGVFALAAVPLIIVGTIGAGIAYLSIAVASTTKVPPLDPWVYLGMLALGCGLLVLAIWVR